MRSLGASTASSACTTSGFRRICLGVAHTVFLYEPASQWQAFFRWMCHPIHLTFHLTLTLTFHLTLTLTFHLTLTSLCGAGLFI